MVKRRALIWTYVAVVIVALSYFSTMIFNSSGREVRADLIRVEPEDMPQMASTNEAIRILVGRVERNPQSFINYTTLGRLHFRQARETGDVASYQRAEAALGQALKLFPGYAPAEAALASVFLAEHRFDEALALAEKVYEKNPGSGMGLATIGDAHLALGNYQEADKAYQELLRRGVKPPVLARLARLTDLKGDKEESLKIIRRAAEEELGSGASREAMAWYLLRVGDLYFNTGRVDEAADHYEAALRIFKNYYLALAGLGKARAAQGRYDEAIGLYEQAAAMIPYPATLAALGDLYTKVGDPIQAQLQYDTVEFIAKLGKMNRQVYNRQLALFYADHDLKLDEALGLASRELEVRKDIYAYDTFAWALFKNGRTDAALEAITEAMKLGTRDAKLYYHAGMIYNRLGNRELAAENLEQALELNPNFSILQGDIAKQTLSELRAQAVLFHNTGGTAR